MLLARSLTKLLCLSLCPLPKLPSYLQYLQTLPLGINKKDPRFSSPSPLRLLPAADPRARVPAPAAPPSPRAPSLPSPPSLPDLVTAAASYPSSSPPSPPRAGRRRRVLPEQVAAASSPRRPSPTAISAPTPANSTEPSERPEGVVLGIMEGPADGQVILSPEDAYRNSSTTSADTNSSSSRHVAELRKLLFRRMLIAVNDGRYFLGLFHCIDKEGNIILQDAVEYRSARHSSSPPTEQRCLGLILIPAACRSSCHVDCFIEEKLSLLSLDE